MRPMPNCLTPHNNNKLAVLTVVTPFSIPFSTVIILARILSADKTDTDLPKPRLVIDRFSLSIIMTSHPSSNFSFPQ